MVKRMTEAVIDAEVDAFYGASHGERYPARVNRRNGYRERTWDTRSGSCSPDWLWAPYKRSEQTLVAAIANAYLASGAWWPPSTRS